MVIGLLGIVKAGAAYLPLDLTYPRERLQLMLTDARPQVVLASRGTLGASALESVSGVLNLDDMLLDSGESDSNASAGLLVSHPAYVIYTSGSSGTPKGVVVTHQGVAALAAAAIQGCAITPRSRVLQFASLNFDASMWELLMALGSGATLVLAPPDALSGSALRALLATQRITHVTLPPIVLRTLKPGTDLTIECLAVAGDALAPDLIAEWSPCARMINAYGPSETTVCATASSPLRTSVGAPIGAPIPGTRIYLLDARLEPVPIGVIGEIYIAGTGLARGYLNRAALTAERFVPDPFGEPGTRMYRSGDLGRWRSDAALDHLGRSDSQVKIRGFRIELGEIEAALSANPSIAQAAVVAQNDHRGGKFLAAYLVPKESRDFDAAQIRTALLTRLPDYMIPGSFVRLAELPLMPNGKLDRRALPAAEPGIPTSHAYEPPDGPVEVALARLLIDLLGVDRVARHDSFFALGLNSLMVVELIERMSQHGWKLNARAVFERPTIAGLAATLNAGDPPPAIPPNRITETASRITPEQLPLVTLDQAQIDAVVSKVPGGVSNVQDIYSLAPLQEGLLIHHRVSGGEDVYVLRSLLSFTSRERVAEFVAALQKVIERHDVLRTSFLWEGLPSAVQVVWRRAELPVEIIDVDATVTRQTLWQTSAGFDVRTAPLIRGHLARDADDAGWLLLLIWHHLVIDHTTLGLLLKEVGAHLAGHHTQLQAPVPFRNFVAEARFDNPPDAHELFFREMLQDVDEPTAPFGLLDSSRSDQGFAEHRIDLDRHLSLGLREQARLMGVTPSSLFHLAWGLLLARTSRRADVVFGTVLFGRMHGAAGVDRAFGLFVNTLPLRLKLGEGAVADSVHRTHALLGSLLLHEHAPLSVAQRASTLSTATPLISALLNYRHNHGGHAVIAGREKVSGIQLLRAEARTHYPMVLIVDDLAVDFSMTVQAPPAIGPDRICGMMQSALESLFQALVSTPYADVRSLQVLRGTERRLLLGRRDVAGLTWPSGATLLPTQARPLDLPDTLPRWFEAQVRRTPDAVALVFGEVRLTYTQLNEQSNHVAHALIERGVGPESIVGLCAERSVQLLIGILGILKAGGAYLPLDPAYPARRWRTMLEQARAPLVLSSRGTAGRWAADGKDGQGLPEGTAFLVLDELAAAMPRRETNPDDAAGLAALKADNAAYVIYTSGSSGTPKGVLVSHGNLLHSTLARLDRYGPSAPRFLLLSSYGFDSSIAGIFWTLCTGGTLVLPADAEHADPQAIGRLIAAHSATHVLAVPVLYSRLLEGARSGMLESLTTVIVAGETCPIELVHRHTQELPRAALYNEYGPTECTVWSTVHQCSALDTGSVPIGRPIDGARVYVLDESLEPAPIGVTGEIYIGGAGVARGYLDQFGLTAERFVADLHGEPGHRMYRSGDLGRWRSDGALEYLGRVDQQIKLRGFRVELGEIEAALRELEEVKEAAVVVRGAGDAEHLAAYVVTRDDTDIETAHWRRQLARRLPGFMVPSVFVSLPAMPLTRTGKLDRRALPAAAPGKPERSHEPPNTPTERRIASIWRQELRVERIGREDDFFELGGHSLTLLRVASRLRDEFGLELPLKILFDAHTLASLAEQIDQNLIARVDPRHLPALVATDWHEPAPLSFSQERMWLIQSLNPATTAYNIVAAIKLHGPLHLEALVESFDELTRRHEMLRMKVRLVEDQPRQVVEPWHGGALEIIELGGEHAEAEAVRQVMLQALVPFDLVQGNILRARLYQLDFNQHLLTLIVHHIAADQWSLGIIGRELATLYNARRRDEPLRLEPLTVSYRDYAEWQRNGSSTVALDRQLAYWRRQLSNLPTIDLPTDRPRPKLATLRGATYERALEAELLTSIEQFGHRAGATLFMALFAGFTALLHRITGQTDIPVGVPVANRAHSAVEGLVGCFINIVVLRSDLTGNPCFADLLRRLKDTAVDAFAAQDVSFDRLVQEIAQRGDPGRAPLVQVMFNVVNAPMHGIAFDGLTWEPLSIDAGGAQFDLSFTIDPEISRNLAVGYSTDLFHHSTIERMVGQYLTLVSAAIAAPEKTIRVLPLMPAEQLLMLGRWNDTAMSLPRMPSFVALFEATAAESPDAPAISVGDARLSYAELNARANRLAAVLGELNVDRSALVAVCMSRSPLLLIGLLAIHKCGAAYLPLDPEFPAERLSYMLADSGARLLLTSGNLPRGLVTPEGVQVLDADAALNREPVSSAEPATFAANPDRHPQPCDRAYVIYTSGSTGRPKGVVVTHGALLNFLHSMRVRPGLTAHDVLAAVTTISFDIAALELYLPLLVGARIELVPRQTASDGAALARLLKSSGATVLQGTPATWRLLLEAGWSGSDRFRALCGGEALSRSLADSLLQRVGELWNLYGPTETTVWSTVERIERGTAAISIGRPIANTQVHILDPAGEQLPVGVVGEIAIGGDGVACGYHGRPALTAERFVPDGCATAAGRRLYLTGDLGRWGADGKLYHVGRGDTQVKIRGFRIELAEIERVLEEQAEVRQAVVVVREAQVDDPRLIAYATFRPGQVLTTADVKERLRWRLPEFMVPSIVVPLQSMPVTPNGKADRAALPDPFRQESPSREAPASETEKIVADAWKSVLNIDSVWVGDNFFDLGGYSLLSLRVVRQIHERTGRQLDPRVLFFKDLRQVAALLETEPASAASSDV